MDILLFLMLFALAANATADIGYNYQQPRPVANQVLRPSAQLNNNVATALAPQITSQYIPPAPTAQYLQPQFPAPVQFISPPSQYVAPIQQPFVYTPEPQQQQPIVSSKIYIHSAPEETEEIFAGQAQANPGPIRKNYRILFVKAPTYNFKYSLNSLKQAQEANEEKTIIYVLSKKPDITKFQSQLSAMQIEPKTSKPEVYFIKYKTQDEANRAQQEIQAQYDALGGSTSISDEGFAPVTSVIGGGTINGGPNFVQSANSNQQNFLQPPFPGNQGSASSISVDIAPPSLRYLPARKK